MLGSDLVVNTLRKKIVFLTVCVAGMFLYLIWEAMLISYFTVPTRIFPFNSWEEFLTNTDYKVYILMKIIKNNTIIGNMFNMYIFKLENSILSC